MLMQCCAPEGEIGSSTRYAMRFKFSSAACRHPPILIHQLNAGGRVLRHSMYIYLYSISW